jgi:hypothetical protein
MRGELAQSGYAMPCLIARFYIPSPDCPTLAKKDRLDKMIAAHAAFVGVALISPMASVIGTLTPG